VPRGTRLRDLHHFVLFHRDADLVKMDRGRYLRATEVVIVPFKKEAKLPPELVSTF
jgi:hypothetical protein